MRISSAVPDHEDSGRALLTQEASQANGWRFRRSGALLAGAVLLYTCFLLYWTAPRHGEFWWSDAPRHALNGIFLRDLLAAMPFGHWQDFATNYYLHYPALTLGFYPPGYAVLAAPFFAVFGPTHAAAQAAVSACTLLAAWASYLLCRRLMPGVAACAAAVVFLTLPETALWGRQPMLELPACAFLFGAAYACLRYREARQAHWLYAFAGCFVAALYMKQTVAFLLPVCFALLVTNTGPKLWRDRHVWLAFLLSAVLLSPLAAMTWWFGQVNANSIGGGDWNKVSRLSAANWVYYGGILPAQMGWPVLVASLTGFVVLVRSGEWRAPAWKLIGGWFATGYLFFSLIALKEPRHTVVLLLPLAALSAYGLWRLEHWMKPGSQGWLAGALAVITLGTTLVAHPVPAVQGYREAAEYVAASAPPNSVVLFAGERDGSFTFNLRASGNPKDLIVLRADKLLLRITQRRELGVQELPLSEAGIEHLLQQYGVAYVVHQRNFWDDLAVLRRFERVLQGSSFERVLVIPLHANVAARDRILDVYRVKNPVRSASQVRLELGLAGFTLEGKLEK